MYRKIIAYWKKENKPNFVLSMVLHCLLFMSVKSYSLYLCIMNSKMDIHEIL